MSISTSLIMAPMPATARPEVAQTSATAKAQAGVLTAQGARLTTASSTGPATARATPEPKPTDLRPHDLNKLEAERSDAGKLTQEQSQKALDEINQVMGAFALSVRFQIDPEDRQVVIKVVDQESGKVIRQYPSEEVVRMSKALDNLKGLLFAQAV